MDEKSSLFFHNQYHTFNEVYFEIEKLLARSSISEENEFLLKVAVLIHDIGYLKQYHDNEEIAIEFAKDYLPQLDFSFNQIEIIRKYINATKTIFLGGKLQQNCNAYSLEEQLLCDADLSCFGRTNIVKRLNDLRTEFIAHSIIMSPYDFFERQLLILKNHAFHTDVANLRYSNQKEKNIEIIDLYLRELKQISFEK